MSQNGFIFPNFRVENSKNIWVATTQWTISRGFTKSARHHHHHHWRFRSKWQHLHRRCFLVKKTPEISEECHRVGFWKLLLGIPYLVRICIIYIATIPTLVLAYESLLHAMTIRMSSCIRKNMSWKLSDTRPLKHHETQNMLHRQQGVPLWPVLPIWPFRMAWAQWKKSTKVAQQPTITKTAKRPR